MYRICICGPDGAGKTTVLKLVRYLLERKFKLRTMYMWMRGTHTIASLLARILAKFSSFRGIDIPHYNVRIPERMKSLWAFLESLSAILYLVPRLILAQVARVDILLADRCLIDTFVWICTTLRSVKLARSPQLRLLLLVNENIFNKTLYLTANISTLIRRKREYSLRFVLYQVAIYNVLSRYLGYTKIDTTSDNVVRTAQRTLQTLELA